MEILREIREMRDFLDRMNPARVRGYHADWARTYVVGRTRHRGHPSRPPTQPLKFP